MALWIIGIVSVLLGSIEQFLINESQIMAVIILLSGVSILFIIKKKNVEISVWQLYLLRIVTALHLIGVFSDRWIVYTGLGALTVVSGIVLTVVALWKNRADKMMKTVLKIICSVVIILFSSVIMAITFFPKASFSVFKSVINAYGNETTAQACEDTLENGAHLVANIQYDTVYPNGF